MFYFNTDNQDLSYSEEFINTLFKKILEKFTGETQAQYEQFSLSEKYKATLFLCQLLRKNLFQSTHEINANFSGEIGKLLIDLPRNEETINILLDVFEDAILTQYPASKEKIETHKQLCITDISEWPLEHFFYLANILNKEEHEIISPQIKDFDITFYNNLIRFLKNTKVINSHEINEISSILLGDGPIADKAPQVLDTFEKIKLSIPKKLESITHKFKLAHSQIITNSFGNRDRLLELLFNDLNNLKRTTLLADQVSIYKLSAMDEITITSCNDTIDMWLGFKRIFNQFQTYSNNHKLYFDNDQKIEQLKKVFSDFDHRLSKYSDLLSADMQLNARIQRCMQILSRTQTNAHSFPDELEEEILGYITTQTDISINSKMLRAYPIIQDISLISNQTQTQQGKNISDLLALQEELKDSLYFIEYSQNDEEERTSYVALLQDQNKNFIEQINLSKQDTNLYDKLLLMFMKLDQDILKEMGSIFSKLEEITEQQLNNLKTASPRLFKH